MCPDSAIAQSLTTNEVRAAGIGEDNFSRNKSSNINGVCEETSFAVSCGDPTRMMVHGVDMTEEVTEAVTSLKSKLRLLSEHLNCVDDPAAVIECLKAMSSVGIVIERYKKLCIFNVPASCLPSLKPASRPAKVEDQQLRYFLQKDKITSFDAFKPERNLQKQYKNLIISRSKERLVCLFMTDNFSECSLSVIFENKPTLCSPLTLSAFKNGISVPQFKTLNSNNGLRSYTQSDETVRLAVNYDIPFDKMIQNVVTLQAHTSAYVDTEKEKKLVFLTSVGTFIIEAVFHE
ncbi:hypothetical protein FHG87_000928 [Trinorchestia longiramus]|nr:hypothetical protein FHG87_000928 [Trinorchestia longiramus]